MLSGVSDTTPPVDHGEGEGDHSSPTQESLSRIQALSAECIGLRRVLEALRDTSHAYRAQPLLPSPCFPSAALFSPSRRGVAAYVEDVALPPPPPYPKGAHPPSDELPPPPAPLSLPTEPSHRDSTRLDTPPPLHAVQGLPSYPTPQHELSPHPESLDHPGPPAPYQLPAHAQLPQPISWTDEPLALSSQTECCPNLPAPHSQPTPPHPAPCAFDDRRSAAGTPATSTRSSVHPTPPSPVESIHPPPSPPLHLPEQYGAGPPGLTTRAVPAHRLTLPQQMRPLAPPSPPPARSVTAQPQPSYPELFHPLPSHLSRPLTPPTQTSTPSSSHHPVAYAAIPSAPSSTCPSSCPPGRSATPHSNPDTGYLPQQSSSPPSPPTPLPEGPVSRGQPRSVTSHSLSTHYLDSIPRGASTPLSPQYIHLHLHPPSASDEASQQNTTRSSDSDVMLDRIADERQRRQALADRFSGSLADPNMLRVQLLEADVAMQACIIEKIRSERTAAVEEAAQLRSQLSEKTLHIAELEGELRKATALSEREHDEAESLRQQVVRLEEERGASARERADMQEGLRRMGSEVDELKASNRDLAETSRELSEALAEARKELRHAAQQHAEAQEELRRTAEEHTVAQAELRRVLEQHAETQQELQQVTEQVRDAGDELERTQKKVALTSDMLERKAVEVADLTRTLESCEAQLGATANELRRKEDEVAEERRQVAEVCRKLEESETRVAETSRLQVELLQELESERQRSAVLTNQNEQLRAAVAELEVQVEELKAAKEGLLGEMETSREAHLKEVQQMRDGQDVLKRELSALSLLTDSHKSKLEAAGATGAVLLSQYQEMQRRWFELTETVERKDIVADAFASTAGMVTLSRNDLGWKANAAMLETTAREQRVVKVGRATIEHLERVGRDEVALHWHEVAVGLVSLARTEGLLVQSRAESRARGEELATARGQLPGLQAALEAEGRACDMARQRGDLLQARTQALEHEAEVLRKAAQLADEAASQSALECDELRKHCQGLETALHIMQQGDAPSVLFDQSEMKADRGDEFIPTEADIKDELLTEMKTSSSLTQECQRLQAALAESREDLARAMGVIADHHRLQAVGLEGEERTQREFVEHQWEAGLKPLAVQAAMAAATWIHARLERGPRRRHV